MLLFESLITAVHDNISIQSRLSDLLEDINLVYTPGLKLDYKALYRKSIKPLQWAYNCRILTINKNGDIRFIYRFNPENN